jgi:threonine synthase
LEAKLIAWIIFDRLDVTFAEEEGFNPTGFFKDRGMAMAISPVPARLDAALAQVGR